MTMTIKETLEVIVYIVIAILVLTTAVVFIGYHLFEKPRRQHQNIHPWW